MGNVILPTGTSVYLDELTGSINLSQLIVDAKCADYTMGYRISTIAALGKLGKHANIAIGDLREIARKTIGGIADSSDKLLGEAAEQAIKKIEEGTSTPSGHKSEPYGPIDNRHTRQHSGWSGTVSPPVIPAYTPPQTVNGKKIEVHTVSFTEIEEAPLHTGLRCYGQCNFCTKTTVANGYQQEFSDRLAGSDKFYCLSCLRNDHHNRYGNNVMILTYRGIIGYYYYSFYVMPKSPMLYMADMGDMLELHLKVGSQNPAFRYDNETFCWFIDFNKIGKTKRKVPIENVLETIIQQLACFNLHDHVRECSPYKLYEKYKHAVNEFYQHRSRVNGDKVFSPTLSGCGIPERAPAGMRALPVDVLQNFLPGYLVDNTTRTSRRS